MNYIGLDTQYKQSGCGHHSKHSGHKQNCCHIVPPTLEVTDVNYEIVREREELRVRIAQLEQNHLSELDVLKNNIIAECESTLEKEIREQELKYENQIARLMQEIDSLTKKNAQIESVNLKFKKEAAELEVSKNELTAKFVRSKKLAQDWEAKHSLAIKELNETFEAKIKKDLTEQEFMLNNSFEREKNRMLTQMEDLKNKISEFQIRMKQVAGELEKIRSELQAKKINAEEWRFKCESLEKSSEIEIYQLRKQANNQLFPSLDDHFERELEALQRLPPQRNLQFEVKELREKLERKKLKLSKMRLEVRVKTETITVEKPVEVEKIVEVIKYIPIEKIVKEIQPSKQPIVIQECGVADKSDTVLRDYQRELEERERAVDKLSQEMEEINTKLRQTQCNYDNLSQEHLLLRQERDNLYSITVFDFILIYLINLQRMSNVNSYNEYIHQLELSYGQKNQDLTNKVQGLYMQMMQNTKNPGKIIVHVGKDGKSTIEQLS